MGDPNQNRHRVNWQSADVEVALQRVKQHREHNHAEQQITAGKVYHGGQEHRRRDKLNACENQPHLIVRAEVACTRRLHLSYRHAQKQTRLPEHDNAENPAQALHRELAVS
jgi:hypothetical protein